MNGLIALVPFLHGKGIIGKMMAHGFGYYIQLPNEPSIYVTGDTILTKEVKKIVGRNQPNIVVFPARGKF
jgi:hypothetical protein